MKKNLFPRIGALALAVMCGLSAVSCDKKGGGPEEPERDMTNIIIVDGREYAFQTEGRLYRYGQFGEGYNIDFSLFTEGLDTETSLGEGCVFYFECSSPDPEALDEGTYSYLEVTNENLEDYPVKKITNSSNLYYYKDQDCLSSIAIRSGGFRVTKNGDVYTIAIDIQAPNGRYAKGTFKGRLLAD